MKSSVSRGRLTADVQSLQAFQTRYIFAQGNTDAGDWLFNTLHSSAACRDDHYSFTALGFAAVTNMKCWNAHNGGPQTTLHYHKNPDTIDTLNLPCMTQVLQVNVAAVAALARPR
jgi:hypothetical protein